MITGRIAALTLTIYLITASFASAQMLRDGIVRRFLGKSEAQPPENANSAGQRNPSLERARVAQSPRTTGESQRPAQSYAKSSQATRAPSLVPTPPTLEEAQARQPAQFNQNSKTDLQIFGAVVQLHTSSKLILVLQVPEASDAYRAGIRRGDALLSVGGIKLDDLTALDGFENLLKPGDRVEILVQRNRKEEKLELVYQADPSISDPSVQSNFSSPDDREFPSQVHVAPRKQMRSLLNLSPEPETTPANPPRTAGLRADQESSQTISRMREIIREQQTLIERQEAELRRLRGASMTTRRR